MGNIDFNIPPPPPLPPKRSKLSELLHKPWFLLLLGIFVVIGVVSVSINRIMIALLHSREEVTVPDLEGKSLVESLRITSELGLSLHQESTEFDDALPGGTVLRQHPEPGMQVRAGRSIQVVVSKGGQGLFVPSVVGRPIAEAQSLIQAERLQMGAVQSIYSTDVAEGLVISQNPSSGTVVTRGALIDVEVSKGLPPAGAPMLPDFSGQSVDKVKEWASGVNATVKIMEDPKAMGAAGTVIKQFPTAGQPLMEGTQIRITVVPLNAQAGDRYRFEVPSDKGTVTVRIIARDNRGESEIYKRTHKGGDTIELPISVSSPTRVRVYVDDALAEEKVIEP